MELYMITIISAECNKYSNNADIFIKTNVILTNRLTSSEMETLAEK